MRLASLSDCRSDSDGFDSHTSRHLMGRKLSRRSAALKTRRRWFEPTLTHWRGWHTGRSTRLESGGAADCRMAGSTPVLSVGRVRTLASQHRSKRCVRLALHWEFDSPPFRFLGSSSNGKIPRLAREGCGFESRRLHLVLVVKRTITLVYEANVAGSNPAEDTSGSTARVAQRTRAADF